MIGKTLAHYEISALLGKGGMGEVYRARDSKLGRDVALKILPRELSGDPERSARFEREARTLASLQHPNIASIYGYEEAEGVRFLTMELVEGEDLAERMARSRLSPDEYLRVAQQLATGLEAAHEKNIVHRDLKPANIKIAPDGVVKILDFGLARAFTGAAAEEQGLENSPTITAAMTQVGTILGTAAYMSPEQARGKAIDKRSDIWSFGVILHEMVTGAQMFQGETVTDVLGAIVHGSPKLDALPTTTPPGMRRLLGRCLMRDVQDRLRDIGEARYALHHLDRKEFDASTRRDPGKHWIWPAVSTLLLILALGLAGLLWSARRTAVPVIQASITLPEGHALLTTGPRGGSVRVSPDGKSIAYVALAERQRQIWVRSLAESRGYPVQGTLGGQRPFWSPDSRSLGFFADGSLRRVSVEGGAPLSIADAADGRGGTWLADGTIVFAPTPGSPLFAVAAGGGQVRQITDPGNYSHREPRVLPDGKHFVHLENRGGGAWGIMASDVEATRTIDVGVSSGGVEFADGRLLYLQGTTLVAQPFDTGSLQLTGEPAPLAEHIVRDSNYGIGVFSASDAGVLAFLASERRAATLQWLDRSGNPLNTVGEAADFSQISISPDGLTAAVLVDEVDGKTDIWLVDLESGARRRFTFTAEGSSLRRSDPNWTPDGKQLYFSATHLTKTAIYRKATDGSSEEELFLEVPDRQLWPYDVSPDGKWLLYGSEGESSNEDLWVVPLSAEGEPRALFETDYDEWPGTFSPDGRWLALDSDQSGRREIYVIPFPERSGRWQISRHGGRYPRWNTQGTQLYYVDLEGNLMAADVDGTGESIRASEPIQLFQAPLATGDYNGYDVDDDNGRFLVIDKPAQYAPISLYVNWKDALDAR